MRSAHALVLGILFVLAAAGMRAQDNPSGQKPDAAKPAAKPAEGTNKAAAAAAKPAPATAKPAGKAGQTPAAAKPAAKPAQSTPKAGDKPAQAAAETKPGPTAAKPAAPAGKTSPTDTKAAARGGKAAAPPAKPAAKAAGKPAAKSAPAAKTGAEAAAQKKAPVEVKKAGKGAEKKAAKVEKKAAGAAGGAAPGFAEEKVVKRDPFESLIGRQKSQADAGRNLPPGKAGLQVNTLRLDGIVRAPNGMIAVVSNPQQRTYFLREGDQLYDGRVEKILMDSVSFHEVGKDAFGKPVERQVNKRINSSPGEQQ